MINLAEWKAESASLRHQSGRVVSDDDSSPCLRSHSEMKPETRSGSLPRAAPPGHSAGCGAGFAWEPRAQALSRWSCRSLEVWPLELAEARAEERLAASRA